MNLLKPGEMDAIERPWKEHASHRARRSVMGLPVGKDFTFWKKGGSIRTDTVGDLARSMWEAAEGNERRYRFLVDNWMKAHGHLSYP